MKGKEIRKWLLSEIEWIMLYAKPECEFDCTFYHHLSLRTEVNVIPWEVEGEG